MTAPEDGNKAKNRIEEFVYPLSGQMLLQQCKSWSVSRENLEGLQKKLR